MQQLNRINPFNRSILMKKLFIFLACLIGLNMSNHTQAQIWHNAKNDGYHIFGQGWSRSSQNKYQRIPETLKSKLNNSGLWIGSRNCAGFYVRFRTDATTISVRYSLTTAATQYMYLSAYGQSGVDLYARSNDGKTFHWMAPHVGNASFGTPAIANYRNVIAQNMEGNNVCEYQLYLPNLNGITMLEVGVNTETETFEWIEAPEEDEQIVAYGSAVVAGASASHVGNSWTNMLGRALDTQVLNFGYATQVKLEEGMFAVLAELKAKVFIIDAMPDMINNVSNIKSGILAGVKTLRAVNQRPILLVESPGTADKLIRPELEARHTAANAELRKAYDELTEAGYHNIFYMTQEEIGLTADDFLDGIDVNDLGMKHYAEAYLKKLAYIEQHKENIPDGITDLEATKGTGKVYDLTGRPANEKHLTKGVYIRNGKKEAISK